jgi:hypothetical protein
MPAQWTTAIIARAASRLNCNHREYGERNRGYDTGTTWALDIAERHELETLHPTYDDLGIRIHLTLMELVQLAPSLENVVGAIGPVNNDDDQAVANDLAFACGQREIQGRHPPEDDHPPGHNTLVHGPAYGQDRHWAPRTG